MTNWQTSVPFTLLLEIVEKAASERFQAEIERVRSACMNCHVLEEVPYFTVELPERRLSPIRTIR